MTYIFLAVHYPAAGCGDDVYARTLTMAEGGGRDAWQGHPERGHPPW
jgi:hypothetical protein